MSVTQMFVVHLRTMSSTFGVRDQSNLVYFVSFQHTIINSAVEIEIQILTIRLPL